MLWTRLRTFIYDKEHQKYIDDIASKRKTMVSTGDRSAKNPHLQLSTGTNHRPSHQITRFIILLHSWTGIFKTVSTT